MRLPTMAAAFAPPVSCCIQPVELNMCSIIAGAPVPFPFWKKIQVEQILSIQSGGVKPNRLQNLR